MIEWCEKLKLSMNSLFLAVQFLDYFVELNRNIQTIQQKKVDPVQYRLYGTTCLMLAAKSIELDEKIPFVSKVRRYTYLPYEALDFRIANAKLSKLTILVFGCSCKASGLKHQYQNAYLNYWKMQNLNFKSLTDHFIKQVKQPTSILRRAFTADLDFFSLQNYKHRIV